MKINNKYEINPFGNSLDSLFSLLTRNDSSLPYPEPRESGLEKVRSQDNGKEVQLEFLLPGWKRNDLSISLHEYKLQVTGEAKNDKSNKNLFEANDLNYEVLLPQKIDPEKGSAKLEDGVLRIVFPYSSKAKEKIIKIS